jgi:tetratricopeptide (TPR) repeat protein
MTIHGLGGSGKSALALEFGYLALVKDARRLVFWVPALSQDSFERAYRDIGTHLKVPGIKDGNADVLKLVKETLSSSSAGDWLMIIDNADDPGVVFGTQNGTSSVQLSECIPNSDRGAVLFTTRNREVAEELTQSSVLEMNDMTRVEASQLLARRIQKEALLNDEVVVDKLLKTLTYLPLAIVQAVAFINNNSISISEYISLFDHTGTETELLSQQFEDTSRYREVDSTIAKTWHISFNQLCKQDQLAAEYLSFIACIDRTNIPQSLLPRGKSLVQEVKALGTLIAYAFVTERQPPVQDPGRERCFDMHRLVHLASVGWLNEHGEWPLWRSRAVARLTELVPQGGYTQMNVWARYLSHAQHAAKPDGTLDESSRLSLLDRVGRCQATLGRFTTAEKTHRYVLSSRRKTIGEGHSETLSSMHELGLALTYQSKHEEAEAIYRETLAIREAAPELGPMHPVTFISMNNLALVLERQGNLYEAETLNRETLARRESVLGPEHPDTLQSMCNLAGTLTYISKFYEAEQISRETLALRKKVLGPDHPATLMSMNNLAGVLDMMGHYKESEAINRETLARRKAVFGLEHPETLNSFYNVAGVLTKQGQCTYHLLICHEHANIYPDDEAEDLWRQGLAGQEAVLGPGHPDTLKSMYKLATVLDKQKKCTSTYPFQQNVH